MDGWENREQQVITYTDYRQYKAELDAELQKSAEGFVKIGYLLKVARDTGILADSGYANVNDFAKSEYGLDKTQVSRFMRINDRFSEGGYSERLREDCRGYGYAKLSIMLLLPEEINELLSPEYSKAEIQAVKDELDAEEKITDLEVLMEEKDAVQQELDSNLKKAVYQLGHDNTDLYKKLHAAVRHKSMEDMQDALAPDGEKLYSVRVKGTGRMFLAIKGTEISLRDIRSGEKEAYTWEELEAAVAELMHTDKSAESSWEETYHEKMAQIPAPPEPYRKPSRVEKAKMPEKKPEMKKEREALKSEQKLEKSKVAPVQPEPELPEEAGQPEGVEETEQSEAPEDVEDAEEWERPAGQQPEPEDTKGQEEESDEDMEPDMSLDETDGVADWPQAQQEERDTEDGTVDGTDGAGSPKERRKQRIGKLRERIEDRKQYCADCADAFRSKLGTETWKAAHRIAQDMKSTIEAIMDMQEEIDDLQAGIQIAITDFGINGGLDEEKEQ